MKIAALDIGGTSIKAGLCEDGALNCGNEYETQAERGGKFVIHRAIEVISQYSGIDAIGISTAGQVNTRTGCIKFANENIPQYTGMQIRKILEEHFRVPVAVENDVNCAAIGEMEFGAGRELQDFLCVTYGTGIGGAIVLNRQIYHGSDFSGAEFGHLITHGNGRRCNCGQQGCYECYASTSALVRKGMKIDPSLTDGRAIFDRIGETKVQALIDDWLQEILYGLTSLIHIFNPSYIILGGGIMNEAYVVHKLQNSIYERIMPGFSNVSLMQAQLSNRAGLLGASVLAAQLI